MGEFTKGGILSAGQLNEIDKTGTWKKGGILSATQLNKLANQQSGGSSSTETVEIGLTVTAWSPVEYSYYTSYPTTLTTDKTASELDDIRVALVGGNLYPGDIVIKLKRHVSLEPIECFPSIRINEQTSSVSMYFEFPGDNYDYLANISLTANGVYFVSYPVPILPNNTGTITPTS